MVSGRAGACHLPRNEFRNQMLLRGAALRRQPVQNEVMESGLLSDDTGDCHTPLRFVRNDV